MNHMPWTENNIARALAMQVFDRKYLVMVPNCTWTGHETDLLAVTPNLRLIDIEVKISRADLKADAKKEKWWHRRNNFPFTKLSGGFAQAGPPCPDMRNSWPPKVWKHYYALPADIWKPELADSLGSSASGVILLRQRDGHVIAEIARRAKPAPNPEQLQPAEAIELARLASLRMWNAYKALEESKTRMETA